MMSLALVFGHNLQLFSAHDVHLVFLLVLEHSKVEESRPHRPSVVHSTREDVRGEVVLVGTTGSQQGRAHLKTFSGRTKRSIGEVFVSSIYNVPCMHVRML